MFGPAVFIFGETVFFDLGKVALKGAPAFDLQGIDGGQAAAAIVAAVPLEPAAVVGAVEPAFAVPGAEGLAAFDLKVVAARVGGAWGKGVFFEGAQELEFNTDPPNAKGPNKSYVITGLKNLMGPPDYEVIELGVL